VFNSILIVAALGGLIYGAKRWKSVPEEKRAKYGKKIILYGIAATVLGLVLAGRAHWLMGVLAALLALAGRAAQLAQYAPLFEKIFGLKSIFGEEQIAGSSRGQGAAANIDMSKRDAADILGLDVSASEEEIRKAHKKLMQKIHPDRGGSDALAKQINLAKDVLLS